MKKILLVFGTRPEAIKMARLVQILRELSSEFNLIVCVTAQHREMLDQVLGSFKIKPDIDLNLMTSGQDLASITSSIILNMQSVINLHKPELVLVHGDTTTAFATSLASFYCRVPVGHVEAGLRTFDIDAPYPEEFNRRVVSTIARWHFAPTMESKANLIAEKIADQSVIVTGNTVIDALMWMDSLLNSDETLFNKIDCDFRSILEFSPSEQKYILITGHRRENFGKGILEICAALKELSQKYSSLHFIYPVHLNPNVQKPVNKLIGHIDNIHLIPPQDYQHFVFLLKHTYLVLTDSGGIQEEAPSLDKPVLVMRETTERPEAIESGTAILIGANQAAIVSKVSELLESKEIYDAMAEARNPYGDGKSAAKIVEFLRQI
jgi:UDP-N-acetylglucosamine 2-epimerase (non-hydrolysing)